MNVYKVHIYQKNINSRACVKPSMLHKVKSAQVCSRTDIVMCIGACERLAMAVWRYSLIIQTARCFQSDLSPLNFALDIHLERKERKKSNLQKIM